MRPSHAALLALATLSLAGCLKAKKCPAELTCSDGAVCVNGDCVQLPNSSTGSSGSTGSTSSAASSSSGSTGSTGSTSTSGSSSGSTSGSSSSSGSAGTTGGPDYGLACDLSPRFLSDSQTAYCATGLGAVDCADAGPDFDGQDGQVLMAGPEYNPGTGFVYDPTSDLDWLEPPPSGMRNLASAEAACTNSPVGTFRLPTLLELEGILDLGRTGAPLVDDHFTGPADAGTGELRTWTSTTVFPDGGGGWYVVDVDHAVVSVVTDDTEPHFARCVRLSITETPPSCTGATPRFTPDFSTHTALDNRTGYTWTRVVDDNGGTGFNWSQALGLCNSLPNSGVAWRLPTIKELLQVADYRAGGTRPYLNPVFDAAALAGAPSPSLWSSTPQTRPDLSASSPQVLVLDLTTGGVVGIDFDSMGGVGVLCVQTP